MINYCSQIRKKFKQETLNCVYPYPTQGNPFAYKVRTMAMWSGLVLPTKFFEEKYGWEFYVYRNRFYIIKDEQIIFKSFDGCGISGGNLIEGLYEKDEVFVFMLVQHIISRLRVHYNTWGTWGMIDFLDSVFAYLWNQTYYQEFRELFVFFKSHYTFDDGFNINFSIRKDAHKEIWKKVYIKFNRAVRIYLANKSS